MNSNIQVEPRPEGEVRSTAAGKAVAKPAQTSRPCDLVCREVFGPGTVRDRDRVSIDPLSATDRYRLVRAVPLPQ